MNEELINEKFKVANHRIDDLEIEVKDIKELTIAMSRMSDKVDVLAGCMAEVKTELKEIVKRPAENANKFYMAVVCAVGTGVVGVVLGLIFK